MITRYKMELERAKISIRKKNWAKSGLKNGSVGSQGCLERLRCTGKLLRSNGGMLATGNWQGSQHLKANTKDSCRDRGGNGCSSTQVQRQKGEWIQLNSGARRKA